MNGAEGMYNDSSYQHEYTVLKKTKNTIGTFKDTFLIQGNKIKYIMLFQYTLLVLIVFSCHSFSLSAVFSVYTCIDITFPWFNCLSLMC